MSIIKTLAHDRIINFMPCNEGSGTTVTAEGGAQISDAALTWSGEYAQFKTNASAAALNAGAWGSPAAGSDFLCLISMHFVAATIGVLAFGNDTHKIAFTVGANITLTGATGALNIPDAPANDTAERLLIAFDSDGQTTVWSAGVGSELSGGGISGDSAVCGDLTNIDAKYSTSLLGTSIDVMGMQMIEFPNGLPDTETILREANATFSAWESGNHRHYHLVA